MKTKLQQRKSKGYWRIYLKNKRSENREGSIQGIGLSTTKELGLLEITDQVSSFERECEMDLLLFNQLSSFGNRSNRK